MASHSFPTFCLAISLFIVQYHSLRERTSEKRKTLCLAHYAVRPNKYVLQL